MQHHDNNRKPTLTIHLPLPMSFTHRFICFCDVSYHPFISSWKMPFSISYKAALVLKLLFVQESLYFSFISVGQICHAWYSWWTEGFLSSILNISSYFLLPCKVSVEKCHSLMGISLYVMCWFFLFLLKFSLYLWLLTIEL